jgi:hypothetical protein
LLDFDAFDNHAQPSFQYIIACRPSEVKHVFYFLERILLFARSAVCCVLRRAQRAAGCRPCGGLRPNEFFVGLDVSGKDCKEEWVKLEA